MNSPEIGDFLWIRREKPEFPEAIAEITHLACNAAFPVSAPFSDYIIQNGFPEKYEKIIKAAEQEAGLTACELYPMTGTEMRLLSEEM